MPALDILRTWLHQQKRRGTVRFRLAPDAQVHLSTLAARASASTPFARTPARAPEPPAAAARRPVAPALSASPAPTPSTRAPADPAPAPPPAVLELPPGDKESQLAHLRQLALACQKCPHLVRSRSSVVFGVGAAEAQLMFVGEAPGADEDRQGEPFVGRAGQLLNRIIEATGLSRADVYIANILKCRPDMPPNAPGNRAPTAEEMATCSPFVLAQIRVIQPRVIVALGATAVRGLLHEARPISQLRGTWLEFQGVPVMPTFHPSYLLRPTSTNEVKRKVWEDMMLVMERLNLPISEKQRGFFLSRK